MGQAQHELLGANREQGVLVATCACAERLQAKDFHDLSRAFASHKWTAARETEARRSA